MSEVARASVALSLVSHTNAGKTTLARTLLGRDIGEVRDAPHVTEFADAHTLLETAAGERLVLWDTPGFGDSVRLAKRLRDAERPLVRFLGETWDRWRDRPFWATQQALRNVRDEADAMLYLVDASQSPEAAAYVAPEMELLAWVGKPVIVLLNQLGAPRASAGAHDDETRWRRHLASFAIVRAVLPLDAFARCWVQELTLLDAVRKALPPERRPLMARLRDAWRARRTGVFEAAVRSLAQSLARSALATEPLPERGDLRTRLRHAGAALGIGQADDTPAARAQRALAEGLDEEARASTLALIRLHGLGGSAERDIPARLASQYEMRLRLDETQAAMWGGAVTGALVGLKADVLSGGLTLGGGMLTGGLLGALGSAGLARCVNLVRGTDRSLVAWKPEALEAIAEAALLRYLAVAHFGRGRGDWAQGEAPPHWKDVVAAALAPYHEALGAAWSERVLGRDDASEAAALTVLVERLVPVVRGAAWSALRTLYPDAGMAGEAPDDAPALPDNPS
ncbi:MAG: GTPase domain-containing protein [Caldimonas sp.]